MRISSAVADSAGQLLLLRSGADDVDLSNLPRSVTIYEVGPRDGLQNEPTQLSTDDKVAFVERLADAGLRFVEMTSFVSPKWIPALADGPDVARRVRRRDGVVYGALVPNRRGLDAALSAKLPEIAVFLSASETHNKKNVNKTIGETLRAFEDVVPPAREAGVRVRAYVSTVYGCPYEGDVDVTRVEDLCGTLLGMGVYQVSLGDTIGVATPLQVARVLERLLAHVEAAKLALHFHDTRGTALANVLVGLSLGIATVDTAVGGLGGCPYAPGAAGNVATEDVLYMVHGMGLSTGVDLDKICDCASWIGERLSREPASKYLKAHLGARRRSAQP